MAVSYVSIEFTHTTGWLHIFTLEKLSLEALGSWVESFGLKISNWIENRKTNLERGEFLCLREFGIVRDAEKNEMEKLMVCDHAGSWDICGKCEHGTPHAENLMCGPIPCVCMGKNPGQIADVICVKSAEKSN